MIFVIRFHPQFWICPKLGMNLKVGWKQYATSRGNQTSVKGGRGACYDIGSSVEFHPQFWICPTWALILPPELFIKSKSCQNKILQTLGTDTQFHSNSTTQFCSLYQPHSNWGRNRALQYQTKKEPLKECTTMLKIEALQLWKITMWISCEYFYFYFYSWEFFL